MAVWVHFMKDLKKNNVFSWLEGVQTGQEPENLDSKWTGKHNWTCTLRFYSQFVACKKAVPPKRWQQVSGSQLRAAQFNQDFHAELRQTLKRHKKPCIRKLKAIQPNWCMWKGNATTKMTASVGLTAALRAAATPLFNQDFHAELRKTLKRHKKPYICKLRMLQPNCCM